jgi:hypothetical protein
LRDCARKLLELRGVVRGMEAADDAEVAIDLFGGNEFAVHSSER